MERQFIQGGGKARRSPLKHLRKKQSFAASTKSAGGASIGGTFAGDTFAIRPTDASRITLLEPRLTLPNNRASIVEGGGRSSAIRVR